MLTEDSFFEAVCEGDRRQTEMAAQKEMRRLGREDHQKVLKDWEEREKARKQRNEVKKEEWKKMIAEWEVEKLLAKVEGRKFIGGRKPTLVSLGSAEKVELQPKVVAIGEA